MDASMARTADLTCPQCGRHFTFDVWWIVDGAARPDLLARVREGTLHTAICPKCQYQGEVDVPLLLYLPDRTPPLLFSPAQGTTPDQDQEHAAGLISTLRARLGAVWQDSWVEHGIQGIPRPMLPPALRDGLQTAAPEMADQTRPVASLETILTELSRPAGTLEMPRRVALCQQALMLVSRADNPALWAALQGELGNSLAQNPIGERGENLERAIVGYEAALEVITREALPVKWAMTMMNLANVYSDRIYGDRAENLERSIECYKAALEVRTREVLPVEWAETMMNLSNTYVQRIYGERGENLDRAIAGYEVALEVQTRETLPVEWAKTMSNLATAYSDRICGERVENLERAIECCEAAMVVMTRETLPVEWAQTMNNLATTYSQRIRGDRAENLERAIECCEAALEVMTREALPMRWATAMMNLASVYLNRIRGDRAENLERAIEGYEAALEVRTRKALPVEWATTMMNLANAYYSRIRGERGENLERAIEGYEAVLEVRTREALPLAWATTMMNLANAYADRICGEREENLEWAIAGYEAALEVRTREALPMAWAEVMVNLATTYSDRIRGEREENLERAIAGCEAALEIFKPEAFPDDYRRAQRSLAQIYFEQQHWGEAASAARAAMGAGEALYQSAASPEARQAELRAVWNLPELLAYSLIRAAETPDALQEAVMILEQNRARWLSEAFDLESARPAAVPEELWEAFGVERDRYRELLVEARLPEGTPGKRLYPILNEEIRKAHQALERSIDRIRGYDEAFMPTPAFAEIRETSGETSLVYLLSTAAGGAALLVQGEEITAVWLAGLTQATLLQQLETWFGAYGRFLKAYQALKLAEREPHSDVLALETFGREFKMAYSAWMDAVTATTRWLWDAGMGQMLEVLGSKDLSRAVLIPTGLLGLLPLHAVWTEVQGRRRFLLDSVALSYAPSARALRTARNIAGRVVADDLFAVDNPDGSLAYASQALGELYPYFEAPWVAQGVRATRATVEAAVKACNVYHFLCHGSNNWREPLESSLQLYGARLTLRDLLAQHLPGARLAFLSACESGIQNPDSADEVISLAAGFLQAGVAGVVSTLWSVEEESTSKLAGEFYRHWKGEGLPPAEALRRAQLWLRESEDGRWAHPYYWAGFTFTGV